MSEIITPPTYSGAYEAVHQSNQGILVKSERKAPLPTLTIGKSDDINLNMDLNVFVNNEGGGLFTATTKQMSIKENLNQPRLELDTH